VIVGINKTPTKTTGKGKIGEFLISKIFLLTFKRNQSNTFLRFFSNQILENQTNHIFQFSKIRKLLFLKIQNILSNQMSLNI